MPPCGDVARRTAVQLAARRQVLEEATAHIAHGRYAARSGRMPERPAAGGSTIKFSRKLTKTPGAATRR
jgi:hypothetical protein